MAVYFVSDAHLGSNDAEREKLKLENLFSLFDQVRADGSRLYILGDLFDFWFEYKNAIPKQHLKAVFRIASLIEHGIDVHYITGNHDFWLGNFLTHEVGVVVHRDNLEVIEEGKKLLLIHGDGLSPGDWKYRVFVRGPLRNKLAIALYRLLPVDIGIPLAKAVSSTSRNHTSERKADFLKDYEAFAEKKIKEGFDAVLIGHTHVPIQKEFNGGVYINTGDFINHFSYAKLSDGQLTLHYLDKK